MESDVGLNGSLLLPDCVTLDKLTNLSYLRGLMPDNT